MLFMVNQSNYWFVAVGWQGHVAFVKTPMQIKGQFTVPVNVKISGHKGDVYAVAYCENLVATGGIDNRLILWNSQSSSIRTTFQLPKKRPNTFITCIKFAKGLKQIYVIVLQNDGNTHIVNPTSE